MERIVDGNLEIVIAGPVGFANNIYLLIDGETGESAFVDAPGDIGDLVAVAEACGATPRTLLLTHSHPDHVSALAGLKEVYGSWVVADAREPWLEQGWLDRHLRHGETVTVGNLTFDILSVPGHTPGGITFVHGKHAFVGDTLFPGGPGASRSNEALQQEIASITTHLYALPGETHVWPGHGGGTTIAASRDEYAVFAAKQHAPDLKGDVLWLRD